MGKVLPDSQIDVKIKLVEVLLPSLNLTLEPTATACKVYIKGR